QGATGAPPPQEGLARRRVPAKPGIKGVRRASLPAIAGKRNGLDADRLFDQDDRRPARLALGAVDQDLRSLGADTEGLPKPCVLVRKDVLLDPAQGLGEVADQLLAA